MKLYSAIQEQRKCAPVNKDARRSSSTSRLLNTIATSDTMTQAMTMGVARSLSPFAELREQERLQVGELLLLLLLIQRRSHRVSPFVANERVRATRIENRRT